MPDRPSLRTPTSLQPCCRAVAALTLALLPALAQADVEWHADLDTARAAARISRRPVLAVFVASWSADATALETTSLGSPEAEAVLATCFEPVRIDIDDRPDLTRTAGITHVPTACVLADDGATLVSFEMPESATEFVTTAILTAQRVAAREAGASNADDASSPTPAPATEAGAGAGAGAELPVTAAAFGSTTDPAAITARPPRGSMARVAAKVRDLSAFARSQSQPAPRAEPTAIAHATRSVSDTASYPAPVSWPAMPSTAPPTSLAPPPPLDPAPTSLTPTAVAPWLDAPPAPRPASAPLAAAATPAPSTAPLPSTTPSPAPAAARQSGLIAALQKPFGLGPKSEPPATMPPALPRGPFAAATEPPTPPQATPPQATPPQAMTPAATASEEDRYGSMPLGLEGYCPVTLVDRGSWQEGRAQWGARHRGRTYLFAGPDEQRTFLSNPDRYAPALSGDDPVLALDRGTMTPGQRRYGVTYQARMYLFATPETRQAFTADPGRYVGRVTIAERTPAPNSATRLY